MEFVPLSTIVPLISAQVAKTAEAANEVLFEKESFKILSKHLMGIEPVLTQLISSNLPDSPASREALSSLDNDLRKANTLIENCTNRSRFYLLIKCRAISSEIQEATRNIARSLTSLTLANADLLVEISDKVNGLLTEMERFEFRTRESTLQIVEKLNQGLRNQELDRGFANDILEDIARAVGVPVEASEINKELASFRREKEEATRLKKQEEEFFLAQVIELLSRADASRDFEEAKRRYNQRLQMVEKCKSTGKCIEPLPAFFCPLTETIMTDPVSFSTGTTCERAAAESWLESGQRTDPTGDVLHDFSIRPNLPLRRAIEEWKERNYCLKIKSAKEFLLMNDSVARREALVLIHTLLKEDPINRDWVSVGGVIDILITLLTDSCTDVTDTVLITLKMIVNSHDNNKEMVLQLDGLNRIVDCLVSGPKVSKPAVELLHELLLNRNGWNVPVCRRLSENSVSVLFLVALVNGTILESSALAKKILEMLFEIDGQNVFRAAKSGWFKPLIDRLAEGSDANACSLLKHVVSMEDESDFILLGNQGIIPALLETVSSRVFEVRDLSLDALVKLSGCRPNKPAFVQSGVVPLILDSISPGSSRSFNAAKSCEILANLASHGDGINYFVDENGDRTVLLPVIANLLTLHQRAQNARKSALVTLLEICRNEPSAVKAVVLTPDAIPSILKLLDEPRSDTFEVAVNLVFLLSFQEPLHIGEYLHQPVNMRSLVGLLEDQGNAGMQIAAAGIIANLPKSDLGLTKKIAELNGIALLMNAIRSGEMNLIEYALGALFRFTDPGSIETQRMVVKLDAFPVLVRVLRDGTWTAKARAAALIGDLSSSSVKVTGAGKRASSFAMKLRGHRLCQVHGVVCDVRTTFCLVKGNAVGELVRHLGSEDPETAAEVVRALSTIVTGGAQCRGCNVLHEAGAVKELLRAFSFAGDRFKEEALRLFEKLFTTKEMVAIYASASRPLLVRLIAATAPLEGLRFQAARVLALIDTPPR